jgi:hypothetical protein
MVKDDALNFTFSAYIIDDITPTKLPNLAKWQLTGEII